MTGTTPAPSNSKWTYGLGAVIVGVGALLIAFAIVVLKSKTDDGLAALSVIASPIAAIIGAYFGIQISGEAAKSANEAAKDANAKAVQAEDDKTKALNDVAVVMGQLPEDKAAEIGPLLNFSK